jgi:hypothetical protein
MENLLGVIENYQSNIGKKCQKCNAFDGTDKEKHKKFKSGEYFNTIKDVILHPFLNIPAYTFIEDDSYVECRRVKIWTPEI